MRTQKHVMQLIWLNQGAICLSLLCQKFWMQFKHRNRPKEAVVISGNILLSATSHSGHLFDIVCWRSLTERKQPKHVIYAELVRWTWKISKLVIDHFLMSSVWHPFPVSSCSRHTYTLVKQQKTNRKKWLIAF